MPDWLLGKLGRCLQATQKHRPQAGQKRCTARPQSLLIIDVLKLFSLGANQFQNLANDYPETKREYFGVNQYLDNSAFKRVLPNGEVVDRDWFVYCSPAKTCVFCFPCILFSPERIHLSDQGFADWKNIINQLKIHETSPKHINSVLTLCQRNVATGQLTSS